MPSPQRQDQIARAPILANAQEKLARIKLDPMRDDLAPARGVSIGVLLSLACWIAGALIFWAVYTVLP